MLAIDEEARHGRILELLDARKPVFLISLPRSPNGRAGRVNPRTTGS